MPLVGRSAAHAVDVSAELFVVAEPEVVRATTCDPELWSRWFPGARFTSYDDRGPKGERWRVFGTLTGTAEMWLEPHGDGTVVHAYLRVDERESDCLRGFRQASVDARYGVPLLRHLFEIKDSLEAERLPGAARVRLGDRVVSASKSAQQDLTTEGEARDGRSDDVEHPHPR